MLFNNPGNPADLCARQPTTSLHPHRVQPELANSVVAFDMNMRWLRTVA